MYFILLCVWMWFKGLENPCTCNVQVEQSQNWPYAISMQSWQPKRVTRVTRARQATDVFNGDRHAAGNRRSGNIARHCA